MPTWGGYYWGLPTTELAGIDCGNMKLQFGLLRGDLVISNGVEAWVHRGGRWERTDALRAFIKSTQLKPREVCRTFGDRLPDLPPEAFAGRMIGSRGLSRV